MTTTPSPAGKHQDTTTAPAGARFWMGTLAVLTVVELLAVYAVASAGRAGGTLSETVWWLYGPTGTFRWWTVSSLVNALLSWAVVHFMHPAWGPRELAWHALALLALHLTLWAVTR